MTFNFDFHCFPLGFWGGVGVIIVWLAGSIGAELQEDLIQETHDVIIETGLPPTVHHHGPFSVTIDGGSVNANATTTVSVDSDGNNGINDGNDGICVPTTAPDHSLLGAHLRRAGITDLVIAGSWIDFCSIFEFV
jgi:hypothetical protein